MRRNHCTNQKWQAFQIIIHFTMHENIFGSRISNRLTIFDAKSVKTLPQHLYFF